MKKMIIVLIFFCCFISVVSVSAADYHVDKYTQEDNIQNWIKNDAKNGDSLIFNTSNYKLENTLVISKSINVKSYKNTQINFNNNKNLINITGANVNISGLILNHNGQGESIQNNISAISALGKSKKISVKNTVINIKNSYVNGIFIEKWKGNIVNCTIKTNGKYYSIGIVANSWVGNISKSTIRTKGDGSYGIRIHEKWVSNLINNSIYTCNRGATAVLSEYWKGVISKNKIITYGLYSNGLDLKNSKGSIYKSNIKSVGRYALRVSDNVKLINCHFISKKGFEKVYRYRPDLSIAGNIIKSENIYSIQIRNIGHLSSKSCYLGIKVDKIFKKIVINPLKPLEHISIEIEIPKKYSNKKYTKTVKLDYSDKNKENNKENNIKKFKY